MTRKISSQLASAFYGLLEKSASTARNGLAIEHRKKRDRRCGGSFGIDANGGCSVIKLSQTSCFSYGVQNINLNGIRRLKLLFDYICGIIKLHGHGKEF